MSTVNPSRVSSLFQEDAVFIEAAIEATAQVGDDMRDDPKATADTQAMMMIARRFLSNCAPSLLAVLDKHPDAKSTADRLIKIGRNVSATMRYARRTAPKEEGKTEESVYAHSKTKIAATLRLLAEECSGLSAILKGNAPKVPKVRFGKTELQMPIVTLGCMRSQQSWNRAKPEDQVLDMSKVEEDCQKNLVEILRYAYQCGVTHIETAKGYGSSQLQLGFALKELFDSGEIKREDLIIQTKLPLSGNSIQEYKDEILDSIQVLQLDYIDLFTVHGLNMQKHIDLLFNNPKGNLIEACKQLKEEGKLHHIGFSSHAPVKFIQKAIETDEFDYVNLHYQFCGSYTSTGDLEDAGNLSNVRLCHEKDMGVFIISIYDKGGKLYAPSNKLRDLCLPEMEPMTYGSVWVWQHHLFDEKKAPVHTFTVGAARPSDLDQPVLGSLLLQHQDETAEKRQHVTERLEKAMEDSLGKKWVETWHVGVPNAFESKYQTHHTGLVWTCNMIKAWGMLDYAKDRYGPMENFAKVWSGEKTKEENLKNMGFVFGWMPGVAVMPSLDYSPDFANCPEENKERLMEAVQFVHDWASKKKEGEKEKSVPIEWEAAYDMRPWVAFPER